MIYLSSSFSIVELLHLLLQTIPLTNARIQKRYREESDAESVDFVTKKP